MQPTIPYNFINLVGNGILRGVTVVLPTPEVRNLLPYGLELGEQDLTPRGTHPIILFFYDMFRAHMTIPTLLPNMSYHEQIVGVPYAFVTPGLLSGPRSGPFFFMPHLNLDNTLATLGGVLFWGFDKHMANITITENRYAVSALTGDPLISLDFEPVGRYRPITEYPAFKTLYEIMCQPIVSSVPVGVGPWFVCSDFDKKWDTAEVLPLSTVVQIDQAFTAGLPCGRFPAEGRAPGIDASPLGSFAVKARWRQSLIYPCALNAR